jgi:hypothetical protein
LLVHLKEYDFNNIKNFLVSGGRLERGWKEE